MSFVPLLERLAKMLYALFDFLGQLDDTNGNIFYNNSLS